MSSAIVISLSYNSTITKTSEIVFQPGTIYRNACIMHNQTLTYIESFSFLYAWLFNGTAAP